MDHGFQRQRFKSYIDLYNLRDMPQTRKKDGSFARTKAVTDILHYPRLDTVMMIEDAIRTAKEYPTKTQLWRSLRKKVMYQTLLVVLDYLEHRNKVVIDRGKIIWIWDPEAIKKYKKAGLVVG